MENAFHLLQSIYVANIEADYRLNEEPLGTFVAALQCEIETLAQLRSHKNVKTRLIAISKIGVGADNASELFASLIGLSEDIEGTISYFLQTCTPLELHQVLCLAHDLERIQHEQLLLQIRSLFNGEDAGNFDNTTHRVSGFSRDEIKTLVDFIQQDGSILLAQIEMSLLEKVSKQMPGIYHRLELRLQRG